MLHLVKFVPWMIFFILIGTSTSFLYVGNLLGIIIGIVLFLLAIIGFFDGFKKIEASNPASRGLLTIWGERCNVVLKEGWFLMLPRFPFLVDFIQIPIEDQNLDLVFDHIRCRQKTDDGKLTAESGGAVVVEVGLTIFPNYGPKKNRLIDYINVGGITPSSTKNETSTKLQDTIRDVLGEALREHGKDNTWEEMTFSSEKISREIIKLLTHEKCPVDVQPRDFFAQDQYKNGIPDKRGFGIRFRRLNIVRIELDPNSTLSEVAERSAVEEQEKRAEMIETEAIIVMAKKIQKADGKNKDGEWNISLDRALQIIRLERDKNTREVAVSSSGNSILDAAAVIAASNN